MTATAKGGKARRPPAYLSEKASETAEANGFPVLRLKTSTEPGEPPKRVPLFYIDDTAHTMLAEPTASQALRYLDFASRRGTDAGIVFALEQMLGMDGYRALLACDGISGKQFAQITKVVLDTLLGALEDPKDS